MAKRHAKRAYALAEHEDYLQFLKDVKSLVNVKDDMKIISLEELNRFVTKLNNWNLDDDHNGDTSKIRKVGVYTTLADKKISTVLVALDKNDNPILLGPGAGGDPPYHR